MNRRGFLGLLAALPFVKSVAPQEWTYSYVMPEDRVFVRRVFSQGEIAPAIYDTIDFEGIMRRAQEMYGISQTT